MARNRKDKDGGFGTDGLVAVAIDKDKSSQNSLKWAVDNLLQKGQTILLVHVKPRASSVSTNPSTNPNSSSKKTFLFLLLSSFLSWNLMGYLCFVFQRQAKQMVILQW